MPAFSKIGWVYIIKWLIINMTCIGNNSTEVCEMRDRRMQSYESSKKKKMKLFIARVEKRTPKLTLWTRPGIPYRCHRHTHLDPHHE